MPNYQIIRTIKHNDVLSPLFLNPWDSVSKNNYSEILEKVFQEKFNDKSWTFLPYCDFYPRTYAIEKYKALYKEDIYETSPDIKARTFSFSNTNAEDYGYALIEIRSTKSLIKNDKAINIEVRFIKEIQEPAFEYYINYKINQNEIDTTSVPEANKLVFDFTSRRFSQDEYDSIIWPMVVKNKMQSLKNPDRSKIQICYSTLNLAMFIQLISSEYSDRIEVKYAFDLDYEKLNLPHLSANTIYRDIQQAQIHLDTNSFFKLYNASLINQQDTLETGLTTAYALIDLIDFTYKDNLKQFENLSYAQRFYFLQRLSKLADDEDSTYYDIAIHQLSVLKPYYKRIIHDLYMNGLNGNDESLKDLSSKYTNALDEEKSKPSVNQNLSTLKNIMSPNKTNMNIEPNTFLDFDSFDSNDDDLNK